jgi:hypothetical protein
MSDAEEGDESHYKSHDHLDGPLDQYEMGLLSLQLNTAWCVTQSARVMPKA